MESEKSAETRRTKKEKEGTALVWEEDLSPLYMRGSPMVQ